VTSAAEDLRHTVVDLGTRLVGGRPIVLTGSATNSRSMARFFQDAGAARVGSADLAGVPSGIRERLAFYEALLDAPDPGFCRWLDMFDPEGEAMVYAGSFTAGSAVAGRPIIGGRSADHLAAERKDHQETFTRRAGVVRPVNHGLSHLRRPTVVQGVPVAGVAMAASHTYILPLANLAAHLARDCDQLIEREFDSGRPCTFYGFVTPQWCVDFGPVEALVYWHRTTWRINTPGIIWPMSLPRPQIQAARRTVHETAARLHAYTGYVGAYGTDGVIHCGRYLIHEINPRLCAGFRLLDRILKVNLPLAAVDLVLREIRIAGDVLRESLAAAATDIRHDLVERALVFDSNNTLTRPAIAELRHRSSLSPACVHVASLEEEWS
jgi:hypothetical protein